MSELQQGSEPMKKDDIINAAFEEFSRYDYDRASINSIIENSKTSKGTFYHYFSNKVDLYLELVRIASEKKIHFLQVESPELTKITSDSSIFDILRFQIETAVRFGLAYPIYAEFSARVANETNPDIKNKVESMIRSAAKDYLNPLIQMNIRQKILREDLPSEFICRLLPYMISHFSDFVVSDGTKMDSQYSPQIMRDLEYYIDFLENGLAQIPKK